MIRTTSLLIALGTLACLVQRADAWIAPQRIEDFAPGRKTYFIDINRWNMNSADKVDGMRAWVDYRYFRSGDRIGTDYANTGIQVTEQYFASTGLTLFYSQDRGTTSTIADWWAVVTWMYFTTSNTARAWRMLHWNLGVDYIFYRWSYRWYKWIDVSANPASHTWNTAMDYCQNQPKFLGNAGYLVTAHHYWENQFVNVFSGRKQTWLGASDDSQSNDHVWRWVSGPLKTYYDGGKGLPFYGRWCYTTPIGAYYPPWFFPAWYRDMFPNLGSVPPSWKTFMKMCLQRFGNPMWCPDTPIQAITTCSVGCASGAFCQFALGYKCSQVPDAEQNCR